MSHGSNTAKKIREVNVIYCITPIGIAYIVTILGTTQVKIHDVSSRKGKVMLS
jgi:hypothetical protein